MFLLLRRFLMKRLLVIFLAFAVTTGAFAQFSIQAQMHTQLHATFFGGDYQAGPSWRLWPPTGPNNNDTASAQWSAFSFLNTGTWIQVSVDMENVSGFIRLRAFDGAPAAVFRSELLAHMGNAELGFGFSELPFVRWSSITFDNGPNAGIGAGNSTVNPYIFGRFTVAPGTRVYLGLTEAGIAAMGGGQSIGAPIGDGVWSNYNGWNTPLPGFFLGFDHTEPGVFAVGAAFAGIPNIVNAHESSTTYQNLDNIFSWMASVHGDLFNLGPISRLRINLAFYGDPEFGFFGIANGAFSAIANRGNDNHNNAERDALTVMEAMVDFQIPIDNLGLFALSYGIATNFADDSAAFATASQNMNDRLGMQVAAQLTIPFGNGFSAIPGVRFRFIGDGDYSQTSTDLGVALRFNLN